MKKLLALLLISSMAISTAYYPNQVIVNFDCTPYYYNDPYYYSDDPCYLDHAHYHHEPSLPSEKYLRRQLYWLYRYNPHILELAHFPVDYFIHSLTDHIKVLENKMVHKRTGLRSNAMMRGTLFSAFSALWGYLAHDVYTKNIKMKKSHEVIPVIMLGTVSAFLATVAGIQFDRAYRYAERLLDRLERDKRILVVLENIKFSRAR
jgi:hypothetical protein